MIVLSHRRLTSAFRSAQARESQHGFVADIGVSARCQRPKLHDQIVDILSGRPARVTVKLRSELIGGSLVRGDRTGSEHGTQASQISPSQES